MEGFDISRVEKKKYSPGSTAFDFSCEDDITQDFEIGIGDQNDLEQDYLTKLRTQRQRIQRLQKCYSQKQQQLSKQTNRTNQLLFEIERLTQFIPYKQKYEELKQDYTDLLSRYNFQQNQLQIVKQQLAQVIEENGNTIIRLKSELKNWKQATSASANQLEQTINDREEQVKKLRREWKDKQEQMLNQIKNLSNTVNKLKQQLDNEANIYDKQKDKIIYQIKSRDAAILDLQKSLQHSRKLNNEMKTDISKFSEQVNSRQNQLTTLCTKLKYQINQHKKTICDKDNKLQQFQSEIKKLNQILQQLKKQNQNIKIQYKKSCQLYQCSNKKIKYQTNSQIIRLETFIKELKDTIQELMDIKNHLMIENHKLITLLKKKQQAEKQRKLLLRTQFKEIDRIQKVIDRLE